MLVVTGVKGNQVPMSDIELLIRRVDVPKDARINLGGGHLGREARGWTNPVIFTRVIMPWELWLLNPAS